LRLEAVRLERRSGNSKGVDSLMTKALAGVSRVRRALGGGDPGGTTVRA
ncbi:unnamed protein product, partial [Ectocarpus sp. 8 AP-2014]